MVETEDLKKMTDEELLARLTPIFRNVFGDQSLTLSPDVSAEDLEDWNSISHVTLVVEIESELGIRFKPVEMEQLRSVREMIAMIQSKAPVMAG